MALLSLVPKLSLGTSVAKLRFAGGRREAELRGARSQALLGNAEVREDVHSGCRNGREGGPPAAPPVRPSGLLLVEALVDLLGHVLVFLERRQGLLGEVLQLLVLATPWSARVNSLMPSRGRRPCASRTSCRSPLPCSSRIISTAFCCSGSGFDRDGDVRLLGDLRQVLVRLGVVGHDLLGELLDVRVGRPVLGRSWTSRSRPGCMLAAFLTKVGVGERLLRRPCVPAHRR